jgi:hypothetical protein
MLKYLQNYCLRRGPRARPQNIDGSANKMVVFANRPYIDTYLFVINIGYLLRRLRDHHGCAESRREYTKLSLWIIRMMSYVVREIREKRVRNILITARFVHTHHACNTHHITCTVTCCTSSSSSITVLVIQDPSTIPIDAEEPHVIPLLCTSF